MRKSCIDKNLFLLCLVPALSFSCREKHVHVLDASKQMAETTFSSVTKPVNAKVLAAVSTIIPEWGTKIFSVQVNGKIGYDTRNQISLSSRVSGRIEKLNIKYNYQPVKKGQLIMEVYSPDLAAAQREFLYVVNTADEIMIDKARQRLLLLGMTEANIKDIIYEKEVLYKIPVFSNADGYIVEGSSFQNMPSEADSPVLLRQGQYISAGQTLFTIYRSKGVVAEFALDPSIASKVQKGQKVLINVAGNNKNLVAATISLIEPVFRNEQSFSIARIYLDDHKYPIGQLLTANIPVVFSDGWWLPKKAVWQTGSRTIVFKKEGNSFKPMEVEAVASNNEMVQIKGDLSGWAVASNAYYLVDSEGFINVHTTNTK